MTRRDLHVHTCYCDGKSTPEEAVKAALEKGFGQIGLVAHSYVPFDEESCIKPEKIAEFQGEVRRLKEKYRGKIEVFCGLEEDIFSEQSREGFDYVIGSVHYIKQGGRYFSVDETPEILKNLIDGFYGGDFYSCAEDYFALVGELEKKRPTFIGHFDLIKKFRRFIPFDSREPRYVSAWKTAADRLIKSGLPFEVNTGGIARGYLNEPYPSPEIAEYIKSQGGRLLLSSDAHRPEDIGFDFERLQGLI